MEAEVQARVRLAAVEHDMHLFRNNSGAFEDATGRWVRYGLANESEKINSKYKSGDLIGWKRVIVTPEMVGKPVAVFTSIECKRADWKPDPGDEREHAQRAWADFVNEMGGIGRFATRPEDLD